MAGKTMVYVGAGNPAGSGSPGLWRMDIDAGKWEAISDHGLAPQPEARVIAVHPKNPETVFIGCQRGLYKSTDRGDNWKRSALPEARSVMSLVFRPDNPNVMFLGTEGNEIWRSDDGGESWKYASTIEDPDAVQMMFAIRILGLAIEPKNPDVMYAAMEVGGAARSMDAGKTWTIINKGHSDDGDWLDHHAIVVGGRNSEAIFISNRSGVWRSRNRGDEWDNLHFDKFAPLTYSRGVRVDPNDPNTLYACAGPNFGGEQGGILRSTDLGESWARFDHGVEVNKNTFGVAINPANSNEVFFVNLIGQVFGTRDGGGTFKAYPLPEEANNTGMGIAIAPA